MIDKRAFVQNMGRGYVKFRTQIEIAKTIERDGSNQNTIHRGSRSEYREKIKSQRKSEPDCEFLQFPRSAVPRVRLKSHCSDRWKARFELCMRGTCLSFLYFLVFFSRSYRFLRTSNFYMHQENCAYVAKRNYFLSANRIQTPRIRNENSTLAVCSRAKPTKKSNIIQRTDPVVNRQ